MKKNNGNIKDKAQQKGERRQKLHENQNNIGNDENKPEYTDFNGNPIR